MSYINQVVILQRGPPWLHYCTLPKKPFFPFQLGQEDNVSETQLKAQFTDLL